MAIAIRSPETLRMIEEICQRTGEDPQTVMLKAVQEQLARLPASDYERTAPTRTPEQAHSISSRDLIDELYDENGLHR
jgi:hypothetical protein